MKDWGNFFLFWSIFFIYFCFFFNFLFWDCLKFLKFGIINFECLVFVWLYVFLLFNFKVICILLKLGLLVFVRDNDFFVFIVVGFWDCIDIEYLELFLLILFFLLFFFIGLEGLVKLFVDWSFFLRLILERLRLEKVFFNVFLFCFCFWVIFFSKLLCLLRYFLKSLLFNINLIWGEIDIFFKLFLIRVVIGLFLFFWIGWCFLIGGLLRGLEEFWILLFVLFIFVIVCELSLRCFWDVCELIIME